jgi:FKBP-type peptidyl-prolyl cis-trans isomerase
MTRQKVLASTAVLLVLLLGACGEEKKDSGSNQAGGSQAPASTETSADASAQPEVACSADATELPGGLCYVDTKLGDGPEVKKGDVLKMNYVGKLADGTVFDESSKHGGPFEFKLGAGAVIQGWDEGIPGMRVGGKRTLTIPPEMGYGESGYPPVIPPNATLVFDVEVVSVKSS